MYAALSKLMWLIMLCPQQVAISHAVVHSVWSHPDRVIGHYTHLSVDLLHDKLAGGHCTGTPLSH